MRLWTLHPKYMDARGLVALWRESLLAQAVLKGQTRGYVNHPQLIRFRNTSSPLGAITSYLHVIHSEATKRGYNFDVSKIDLVKDDELIVCTQGQLFYEWIHLKNKLKVRAPSWLLRFKSVCHPKAHPIFRIIPGQVSEWEKNIV